MKIGQSYNSPLAMSRGENMLLQRVLYDDINVNIVLII